MRDFKKLAVWDKAHRLALAVYQETANFPKEEVYGLTAQIRRSAASIPTNIAEGCGREGNAELIRFLNIALGSASELEYQLLLAHDLRYLPSPAYMQHEGAVIEVKMKLKADT